MNAIRKSIAVMLVLFTLVPQCVMAADRVSFDTELEAAVAFADMLSNGQTTLSLSVPTGFDYTLCYRYLSMLYRDAYVFEYIPSPMNSYIRIVYNDEEKHNLALAEAERLAAELIDEEMNQYEKYYAIYSYIRDNCQYDMHAALNQSTETGDAFSAYGALLNGLAVCDGLSSAFAMICRSAGLPCIYVAAPEMNHSWNAVLYNGKVMYLDVTYDLTGGSQDRYFMLDEAALAVDHTWDRDMTKALTDDIWDEGFVSAYTLNQLSGLFRGSDKGWELDRNPTRAEAAIMLVRFLGMEEFVLQQELDLTSLPFEDVNPNHAPYIAALYEMGLTVGTSPTTFSPEIEVRVNDYMTFMLRALGYSEELEHFAWESAPEDALGLGVLNQSQYDLLRQEVFDRGMMAYASLITLMADDANGRPLYMALCENGTLSEKNIQEILF